MYYKRKTSMAGIGWGLLAGAALGAAGCCSVCGVPGRRKVRRRLMNAADAVNDALDNMYRMIK